jgi:hypothetical protein
LSPPHISTIYFYRVTQQSRVQGLGVYFWTFLCRRDRRANCSACCDNKLQLHKTPNNVLWQVCWAVGSHCNRACVTAKLSKVCDNHRAAYSNSTAPQPYTTNPTRSMHNTMHVNHTSTHNCISTDATDVLSQPLTCPGSGACMGFFSAMCSWHIPYIPYKNPWTIDLVYRCAHSLTI